MLTTKGQCSCHEDMDSIHSGEYQFRHERGKFFFPDEPIGHQEDGESRQGAGKSYRDGVGVKCEQVFIPVVSGARH